MQVIQQRFSYCAVLGFQRACGVQTPKYELLPSSAYKVHTSALFSFQFISVFQF
jgi:hypothetical protein